MPLLLLTRTLILCCCLLFAVTWAGCQDNEKHTCLPQCDSLSCGPDGCGGSCGQCAIGTICTNGQCLATQCRPDCAGKTCGDDGCGGSCGKCGPDTYCQNGQCTQDKCVPDCKDRLCGDDGCGGSCGTCAPGSACQHGQCACLSDCDGRICGDNGCGGSCGTCPSDAACNDSTGQCMPFRVTGKIFIETRTVYFDDYQLPRLDKYLDIPAARIPLALYDGSGRMLGETHIEDDGSFYFELNRLPVMTDWLSITPLWYHQDKLKLAILMADINNKRPLDIWSWTIRLSNFVTTADPGHLGDVRIAISDASGGLFLYQQLVTAFEDLVNYGFVNSLNSLPSMSVVWKPGITWSCGTCYIDASPLEVGKSTTATAMYIGGHSAEESAWGTPTVLHEFGHYVAKRTRDDSSGGSHAMNTKCHPTLAWSEGFATFYALMIQSLRKGEPVHHYWRVVQNGSFWIDYSRLAGSVTLPHPDPGQNMRQNLGEAWVTYMLWDFLDGLDIADPTTPPDDVRLGTAEVWRALYSPRYLSPINDGRSVWGVDFVDFVDAIICNNPDAADDIMALLHDRNFPYDNQPACK